MSKNFLVPINLNGLEIQNFLAHNLASAPTGIAGRIYFNTADHKLYYHNGTSWVDVTANLITGVKGNAETTYRTGNVNLTPANIGAAPTSHASSGTTYGKATNSNYGHAKLSDSTNSSLAAASDGTAATPKAVKDALDDAKAYADGIIAASDAMVFKGTLGTGGTITALPTAYKVGDTYRVITAGTYGYGTTKTLKCEIGDLIIAVTGRSGSGNVDADWVIAQTNITGITKTDGDFVTGGSKTSIPNISKKTVVIGGTTTSIPNISKKTVVTGVTKKTVVTGGSKTSIPNITKKTVVTSASGASASYSDGVLTITNGSFSTGDSVTVGTPIEAYTSLSTGDSVTVSTGDSVTVGTPIDAYTGLTTGDSVTVGTAIQAYTSLSTAKAITDVSFTTD